MPVHEVKIDRSFVQGLESDPEFAPVVRSAIDMGHGLGLEGKVRVPVIAVPVDFPIEDLADTVNLALY
jgi:predicted signal transduction protein with EAL and GGDEF domain